MEDVFFADLGLTFSEDVSVRATQFTQLTQKLKSRVHSNRPPIPEFTALADEYQQAVIDSNEKTIRLIAPAGSGKTQTMINRVLRKIQDGTDPARVLLLTFDNSAAGALKFKLEETIDDSGEARAVGTYFDRLQITTLNAFSNRLLGEFAKQEQKKIASVDQQYDSFRVVRSSLKATKSDLDALIPHNLLPQFFLDLFAFLKNEVQDPRDPDMGKILNYLYDSKFAQALFEVPKHDSLNPERTTKLAQVVAALFVLYDRELQSRRLMDFDDQKLRLYKLLQENQAVLGSVRQRYDEVIVDEFQDINRLDFEIIKLIASDSILVVTGDDDQAIYGFRGCSPDYIIELSRHLLRDVSSFELQVNYRSPANIVRHADRLIRHNDRRLPKSPIPYHPHDATISLIPTLSSALEAKSVRDLVLTAVSEPSNVQYKDIAILYRTNAQSLPLQIEFLLAGIPYYVREEDNVLTNQSLVRMLSLLRVKLAKVGDEPAKIEDQLNVLRSYFRQVSDQSESELRKLALNGVDLLDEDSFSAVSEVFPRIRSSRFYSDFNELLTADTLSDELDIIAKRFDKGLKGMIGSLEDALAQDVPLAEVFDMARDYEGNTQEFLGMIDRALTSGRNAKAGKNSHGVSLLTYFKSKGRQWHTVILLSCNEGFIPHALSQVEEERRLFYVAMTRASSDLILSYVENAVHRSLKPSRFLLEAGLLADTTSAT